MSLKKHPFAKKLKLTCSFSQLICRWHSNVL
jgi:hypothetical protein